MGKIKKWFTNHAVETIVIGGATVVFIAGGYIGYKLGLLNGLNEGFNRGIAQVCKTLWQDIAHLPVSENFNILCDADHSPELTEAAIEHLKSKGFDPANATYVILATDPK